VQALNRGTHVNRHLQSSWNQYGPCVFTFGVLELVADIKNLILREQYYLDQKQAYNDMYGYNIGICADNGMRGRKHTPETIKKYSETRSGSKNSQYGLLGTLSPNYGSHRSETTKALLREVRLGKTYEDIFGAVEARRIAQKISAAKSGRSYIELYGPEKAEKLKKAASVRMLRENLSPERLEMLRLAALGANNPMYDVHRFGKSNPFYDKTHTDETRAKMKAAWVLRKLKVKTAVAA